MKTDIYISGEINEEAFVEFDKELSRLLVSKCKEIRVTLISEGGCAKAALAFFDRIVHSTKPVIITAIGSVESAAVLILAAGQHRRMHENAWVMVHEDSIEGIEGSKTSDLEKTAKHFRRMEDQWCYLLSLCTRTSQEQWSVFHRAETYLSALQCKNLGLIEEIICLTSQAR